MQCRRGSLSFASIVRLNIALCHLGDKFASQRVQVGTIDNVLACCPSLYVVSCQMFLIRGVL